jgi:hypothetical protein
MSFKETLTVLTSKVLAFRTICLTSATIFKVEKGTRGGVVRET